MPPGDIQKMFAWATVRDVVLFFWEKPAESTSALSNRPLTKKLKRVYMYYM